MAYKFETLQLHVGQEEADKATDSRAVPIYQTTSYVFHNSQHAADRFGLRDAGNIYGRLTNSTQDVLEKRLAALEGGVAALAVASGAASISYVIQALGANGGHIVAQKSIYGGSYNLLAHTLPLYGITTTFVDIHNLKEVEAAIKDNTRAIYIETLGNPNSDIPDIDALSELAHKNRIPLVVDNTFATPFLLRPIEHGADIVVHSATKFIGGHGTTLGGIVVDSGKFNWAASGKFPHIAESNPSYHGISFVEAVGPAAFAVYLRAILLRDTGATISPFNAFLLLQGVETLSLRIERHAQNTTRVIEYLKNHPQVKKVNHPSLEAHPQHELYKRYFPNGGGSIFTFDIEGGQKEAHKFIDSLKIFSLLANVADVKSLVIHPATTTHSQLSDSELADQGIYQSTIRLSIGTENIDDIIEDLDNAFKEVLKSSSNTNDQDGNIQKAS
ncbi:O-acetylhomoserine aminocarboxypropyltransferase/cysteine synthase family protein [Succinivibrio dextrinosolvens]|uniref:O-acetylhomoserine aminocarboxypropyltransferase/cysteine synthase family protein n=1 Tax=Succinivibrio dextrinosolvens TaxID=83771 RepID=UPI002479C4EA|nr:O-acetylhomoserine aminocarboxypropyltransferase/cysteine synthase family protein [Succinivibrio dextrinosolvens]